MVNLVCSRSNEITREKAEKMIVEKFGYPRAHEIEIDWQNIYFLKKLSQKLEGRGWIYREQGKSYTGSITGITEQGKKQGLSLVEHISGFLPSNTVKGKICEERFIEATGIIKKERTLAFVEYTYKYDNPTEFYKIIESVVEDINRPRPSTLENIILSGSTITLPKLNEIRSNQLRFIL